MKVVILSPNPPDCVSFGPRTLSSVLRDAGIDCSVVFLRGSVGKNTFNSEFVYQYPQSMIDDILEICAEADVVGVSFMSLYYDRAVQLTRAVQELGKPVIWGGTHPTLRPEQSIRIADYVCVGEGEIAFIEWLNRFEQNGDLTNIQGIWAREADEVVSNGEAAEVPDINDLPWPDFDTPGHFVDDGERVVPMSDEMMYRVLPRLPGRNGTQNIGIRVMATRGCPHRCTYCASSAQKTMRRRSVRSTLDHMGWLKERYPFLDAIYEFDDTFFATPKRWLTEFAEGFKREIDLPWYCQTSPSTLSRSRLDLLVESGLIFCEMGIQSGSDEIKDLFKRTETEKQVQSAAQLLNEYYEAGKLLTPRYHVITDVPWESNDSVLQTIRLLISLPRPFTLAIGSLCLFPGTALNDRARKDGLLWDEVNQVYRKPFLKPQPSLQNWFIAASGMNWIPQTWLQSLVDGNIIERFGADGGSRPTRRTRALHRTTRLLDRVPRAIDALRNQDLERIRMAFQQPE